MTALLGAAMDLTGKLRGAGFLFTGIVKDTQTLKSAGIHEFQETLEMLLGFSGEPDNEGRPDRQSGNAGAHPVDQAFDMSAIRFAAHGIQHHVMDVLERHIDIAGYLRIAGDSGDHVIAPVGRMGVEKTDPELARDRCQGVEQCGKSGASGFIDRLTRSGLLLPEIHSIVGGVLADEIDLLHAGSHQSLDFLHHGLDRATTVTAAHPRNDAEGTGVIASFGDFHISGVGSRETDTWRVVVGNVGGTA